MIFKISKCTSRMGDGQKDNGWAYKKCIEKYKPIEPIEKVIHGANPNKGLPEIKQDLIKGNKMNFKQRLVEEAFEDFGQKLKSGIGSVYAKTKEFAGNNPGVAAGISGAAAGALYNYLNGGAEDLQQERVQELNNYIEKDSNSDLFNAKHLSKDDFTDLRDNFIHSADYDSSIGPIPTPVSWMSGQTEDLYPFTSRGGHQENIQEWIKKHPDINIETIKQPGFVRNEMTVDDFKIKPYGNSDDQYAAYSEEKLNNIKNMSQPEKAAEIEKIPELKTKVDEMRNDIGNSTRDSYLHSTLGGAALGAGGVFAKRKLDERKAQGY